MKLKEFLARRSSAPSHMNPQFMSDEYMNRRRSFGRGGAGNIRSREEATLPTPPLSGIPPNSSHNTDLDPQQYQEGDREREWERERERERQRRRSSVWSSMSISSSSESTGTHDESDALSSSGSWLSGMRQVLSGGSGGGSGGSGGHGHGQSPPPSVPSGRRRKGSL